MEEAELAFVLLRQPPVYPAYFAVLTPRVIVALLRPAELVPCHEHRHALREEEDHCHGLDPTQAQLLHKRVVAWSFAAGVPAQAVIVAVAVLLAIGQVVFFIVADQISKGEAVVAGDEVDRVAGAAAIVLVEV